MDTYVAFFIFQKEKLPEEYFENDPEPEFISTFIGEIFAATLIRSGCGLIALVSYFLFHEGSFLSCTRGIVLYKSRFLK